MGCFDNIISYKGGCDSITPTSGLYTDQVGLHKYEIEMYLQEPYQNAYEFFNDQLNISITEIKNDIYNKFAPAYRAKSIIDGARLGQTQDNMTLQTGSAGLLGGCEIEICQHNSPLEFFISEFSLFVDTTGTVTVNIWDLKQNKILDSFTVDTTANQISTAYPNISIKANSKQLNLLFEYDTTTIDSYNTIIGTNACGSCQDTSYYISNRWVKARGVTISNASDKVQSNLNQINHTSGMSFMYSINCAHEDWICNSNKLFAFSLLNKVAANIVSYGLYSTDRMNDKTLVDRDKLQARINNYTAIYNDTMSKICDRITPPNDPVCYECNNRIKSVISLP